ncbi:uncharacterized protein [Miscanthus floridulus]|uniref:uncharacterized protein n=1 Tax=Miscanthus floridulus TaxID=154761 RepID=UPI003458911D
MYEDTKEFIRRCWKCQFQGSINTRNAMPLHYNLQIEIFDVWGIDFMGPFQKSQDCEYIFVAINYVSKCVEALPCQAAEARHAMKMFHEVIFPHFGTPRMVIRDGGSHFIDKTFRAFLKELGVKHNIATPSLGIQDGLQNPIGMLVEPEHRAHWAIKSWNMDFKLAGKNIQKQIDKLEEWQKKAYHSAQLYKERTKRWHGNRIKLKEFKQGDKVLLFN